MPDIRAAGTLVLLRDGDDGLESLLLRRDPGARFLGGFHVFPGGALGEGDRDLVDTAVREALEECALRVDREALVYFDHWLTPPDRPRRFDTRFFLARAPEGQSASPDGVEVVEARWVRPVEALAEAARGTLQLANATTATLRRLAAHASVDDAMASASAVGTIEPHRPCIAVGRDGVRTFHREDAAYHEIHWCDPGESMATTYDLVPGVPKVLDRWVTRLIAPNPGVMTGPGTNSYVVGEREVAVVDPGPDDDLHVGALVALGRGRIRWILCTHTHRDHSPAAVALARATGAELVGLPPPALAGQDATFVPDRRPCDGEALRLGDIVLTAFHTPGHASNHVCYRLEATRMLFAGDHVMQGSTVVIAPPDGDMRAYVASLERLRGIDVAIIAPGHGYLIGAPSRALERLIAHRRWREARVLSALQRLGPATPDALVDDVYPDLPPALRAAASRSLEAHLLKLVTDGKARCDGTAYAVTSGA